VTGGSRGIGLATVRLLLDEGMHVLAGSRRSTPELDATAAAHLAVDLATPDGPARLVEEALAQFGAIDLLVNNVGVGDTDDQIRGVVEDVSTLSDEAWRFTFDLHFFSALRAIRAALPTLVARRGVISAAGARLVGAGPIDANVGKAALNALNMTGNEMLVDGGIVKNL
jgi:NAD(P)-dependent dehydrogenase (short-subunit alcohol dehydrogenase family)